MIPYTKIEESMSLTVEKVLLHNEILCIKWTNDTYSWLEASTCYDDVIIQEHSSPNYYQNKIKIELGIFPQEEYDEYWKKEEEKSDSFVKERDLNQLKALMAKYPEQAINLGLFPQS